MKTAFTISTINYLHLAKTAGNSFLKYNEGYQFIIFLYDKVDSQFSIDDFAPLKIIEIESLHFPAFDAMSGKYTPFEMCNALKPFIAEYILISNKLIETLVYVDSDILFYDSLKAIESASTHTPIIITNHVSSPPPLDGLLVEEQSFLNCGIYNGGFFVLKPANEVFKFLSWWKARMENYCYVNYSQGMFVDQIWMNLVPSYFTTSCIWKDVGYNMAYWNLHERILKKKDDRYFVNEGYPLVFFHFSGYDVVDPYTISKHQNRFSFESRHDLIEIFKDYRDELVQNDDKGLSGISCFYEVKKQLAIAKAKTINTDNSISKLLSNKKKILKQKIKARLKTIFGL